MPQMNPMNWIMIYTSLFSIQLFTTTFFFFIMKTTKTTNKLSNSKKISMKW